MSEDIDYDSEPASVSRSETRTARKEHVCSACRETIRVGDKYQDLFFVWEGEAYRYKRCARCEAIHRHLRIQCAASGGDLYPAEELNCGHDYFEQWGREPPPEIAALAFALPGETALPKGDAG